MDKFSQLVEDLVSGDLNMLHIQNAYREYIRRSKYIPDQIRDILAGKDDVNPGILVRMFMQISIVVSALELAYRRGESTKEENASKLS